MIRDHDSFRIPKLVGVLGRIAAAAAKRRIKMKTKSFETTKVTFAVP